ncbi:hypothetical protein A2W24_02045 [Microgenomates group bacterium RBG_16_45_19]|nr:MAG: hypothetical protein A2W24_02045 [Microgenomates group bacterium RBG_16_45_19]
MKTYLPIIGLEIHVELRTKSKMFCGCPADHFGKEPNTQTCPVCLGLPGALPVPNQQAIIWTLMIGQAFNATLNLESKFDRKHYFYPDLPKGYQISQYDEPLCSGGVVTLPEGVISLTRIHLEEDTGKLQHTTLNGQPVSLVDFNRSGVPLVEIVSEPQIHSAATAKTYAQTIRQIIHFLGVSDCDMEKGSMRLEANISLMSINPGSKPQTDPGFIRLPQYKVEVKNINSFRFLEKAINAEIQRQTAILDRGQLPRQETRGFTEVTGTTKSQRSKEAAKDYRYFPEPDIPPLKFTPSQFKTLIPQLPLMPQAYLDLFIKTYDLRPDYAQTLTASPKLAAKSLAAFILAQKQGLDPAALANLMINQKAITVKLSPSALVNLLQSKIKTSQPQSKTTTLMPLVREVLKQNPDLVTKYHQGKVSVIGALIGAVKKLSPSPVDPQTVQQLLTQALAQK